jgi:hypothetical protein
MLLQSHEGIIRLFPCWDRKSDAKFENLRADGAFLVSAELKDEKVTTLSLKSLKGRKCTVQCDGIGAVVRKSDGAEVPCERNGDSITFATQADTEYVLI